ncbi:MAG: poly-gamma-glutamate biosynthesis protein PgsC/CapC [Haloferacaceae archaeon]
MSPILLGSPSDVAVALGYGTTSPSPTVGTLGTITVVALVGLFLSEVSRSRLGLRPVGVIALPLGALFALRVWWTVPLYLGVGAVAFGAAVVIHRRTLLYGRALLSLAGALGVALALGATVLFGLSEPLVVFFTGLFAGIGAYNVHVAARRERRAVVLVNAGIFVAVFALARLLIAPLPTGLAASVGRGHLVVAGGVIAAAILVWLDIERDRPSLAAIREAAPFRGEELR